MHKPMRLLPLLALMFHLPLAGAQSYPSKPIRIHTSAAGGATDLLSRVLAAEFTTTLGQPIVVENLSTATLGQGVARAAPDGYTLLVWGPGFWIGPLLQEGTPQYDVIRDFASISTLTRSPTILVVTDSLPVKTVAELVKLAKSKPGEINFLMGANGSSEHIAGEQFKTLTGTDITRVAYKGGVVSGVPDLMAGRLHMTFSSGAIWGSYIKSGKVRVIATGGSRRSNFYPDLPTVAETVPGFVAEQLLGFWGPAKLPDAILKRLNQETVRALEKPAVRDKLLASGLEPAGGAPEQLTEAIRTEIAVVSKIAKEAAKGN